MIGNLLLQIKQFFAELFCIHNYRTKVYLGGYCVCTKCGRLK